MKDDEEYSTDTLETYFALEGAATMEQDHEVVVALGIRAGPNARLKPLSPLNEGVATNAKPGTV
eukprot:2862542-Prorocentrum_lima.AAC.1